MFKGIEHIPYPDRAAAIVREATAELSETFGCPVSIELDTDIEVGETVTARARWVRDDSGLSVERYIDREKLHQGPAAFGLLIALLCIACEAYFKPERRHGY